MDCETGVEVAEPVRRGQFQDGTDVEEDERVQLCGHGQRMLYRYTALQRDDTHVRVGSEFVSHVLELCMAGDGHDAVHDVVLLEELGEHLGGAEGVDVGGHEDDDGGRRGSGGATVSGEDLGVGFAIGRTGL